MSFLRNRAPLLACLLVCAPACADIESDPGVTEPVLGEPEILVPFASPPDGVVTQRSNNNLDIVVHEGRYFFAFRTAPSHFAGEKTVMYVVSSDDQQTWQLETKVELGTDVREPRFLSYKGELFLYFAKLGKDPLKFEPQGTYILRYKGPGDWTSPEEWTDQPGFIPWRLKVIDDTAYMIGYIGGENIYEINGEPIYIQWLKSEDGLTWEPVVPGQPTVEQGGGSETDWAFLPDGGVIAVTRNEAGDETGWGSKICRAQPGSLGEWHCAPDKRKYDSPLVIRHGADIYLVARRNVTETGNYDLERRDLSPKDQTQLYLFEYSFAPKRCSLWKVDPDALSVSFLLDLPSFGDTCFPSALQVGPDEYDIYNYTSPLDGDDVDWIIGQGIDSSIYRIRLQVP
ncbi:MAG: sialidase family protein [Polyangiaceae bacterium]